MTPHPHLAGFSNELEKIALSGAVKFSLIATPLGAAAGAAYAAIKHRNASKKVREAEIRSAAIKGAVTGSMQGLMFGIGADAQAAQRAHIQALSGQVKDLRGAVAPMAESANQMVEALRRLKVAEDHIEGQLVLNLDPKILRQIQRAQKKQKPPAQAALEKTAIDLALAKNLLKLVFTMGFMKAVYDHAASSDE